MILNKKNTSFLIIISFLIIGFLFQLSFKKTQKKTQDFKEIPNDFLFMQRAYPTGIIKTDALKDAIIWKENSKNKEANTILWEFIGPTNIGGRITDIEIPSNVANTYYVGAASGGIFKTTDSGSNWTPIFDDQSMISIGDIEISKTNNDLLFVGTGEVNAGGGSLAYDGNGIYKSIDAGLTWEHKGLDEAGSISKVIINPQDNNTIFAGVMGPLFKNDSNRGVYKSINGGDSWSKVLFVSDSTGVIDMAINPINTNVVYAASWERIRKPNYRSYGGETSRIYRSQDAGDTWSELTNGLPTTASQKGRISIDISISNPNILYASYTDKVGYIQGVYKTNDGGDTWTSVNSSQLYDTSYHWWFGGLFVNPTNPDEIHHAGFYIAKSSDGGNNWSTISAPHVDQHAIAFNTQNPNEVLLGNDGGLYKSTNNGTSYTKINNLPITQFYRYTVDEQNSNKRYGGAQDNNTVRTTTGSNNDWYSIYGGDGFQPLVDPTNTNTVYAMYQRGNFARSLNNANSFSPILNGINSSDRNNWDTPICMDPNDPNILYYGTENLYRTTNRGDSWESVSPDLSNGNSGGNLTFNTISTIEVSPHFSDLIFVGTDDGNIWVTDTPMFEWFHIATGLPDYWVTKIKISPNDGNKMYITYSGYRYGDTDGHVFFSDNQGGSWSDISNNLPDVPVNDIEIDTFGNLFLATDIGVLASSDNGNTWTVFGTNFPAVVVTDLYYHKTSKFLYAATYGRSSYRIDLNNNILATNNDLIANKNILYPNPAQDFVNLSFKDNQIIENIEFVLYDMQGKQIKSSSISSQKVSKNKLKINLNNVKSGHYFLKINYKGQTEIHKLLVRK